MNAPQSSRLLLKTRHVGKSFKRRQCDEKQRIVRKRARKAYPPVWKLAGRLLGRLRDDMKQYCSTKEVNLFETLGYTRHDLFNHLSKFVGTACVEKRRCDGVVLAIENSHIDHIMPIIWAESLKDVIRLNQLKNLRLICGPCNLAKSVKFPNALAEGQTMGLLESLLPKLNIEAIERQALEAAQKQADMLVELKSLNAKLAILVHVAEAWMKENGKT